MDLFEEYLAKQDNEYVKRALTDTSFNAFRCRGIDASHPQFKELHTPLPTNFDMATYGDSILKMILTGYLWNDSEKPTVEKSGLESDLMLVEVVARCYNILEFLKYDTGENDPYGSNHLPQDYDYRSTDDTNKNPHKYIATCVEAMIAAIYLDSPKENFEKLRQLIIEQWVPMIQSSNVYKAWKEHECIDSDVNLSEKIGLLCISNALEKLNELKQPQGIVPEYEEDFKKYGPDEDPTWICVFKIVGTEISFSNEDRKKKDAERKCAYDLLKYLIEK